ncbi:TauD/TfdA family dioxygenase [Lysobacter fragariae]
MTELLDWRQALGPEHLSVADQEPVLVRAGRGSFYTTMLDKHHRFIRQDPACIFGLTDRGRMLQAKINETTRTPVFRMRWKPGRTLIFDNWRLLHRRADASQSGSRSLLRVTIMETTNDS